MCLVSEEAGCSFDQPNSWVLDYSLGKGEDPLICLFCLETHQIFQTLQEVHCLVQHHYTQVLHSRNPGPCSLPHFHNPHYNFWILAPCLALPCWVPWEVHPLQDYLVSTVVPIQAQEEVPQGHQVLPDFPLGPGLQEVPILQLLEVVASFVEQAFLEAAGPLYS